MKEIAVGSLCKLQAFTELKSLENTWMNIVSGIRTRLPLNSVLKLVDFVSINYFSGISVRRGIAVVD